MATPQKLFKDISAGKFKPVYYFFGSEDYRISEAVKFISRQFLPGSQHAVNYIKLDGKKSKSDDIINRLANLPMLGEKQVFVISDFQSFRPTEISKIIKILNPPDPNRIVVLTSPSSKSPKKSSTFYKTMESSAETVEFKRLTLAESLQLVQVKLKKADVHIMPDALKLMAELIDGNRGALETETAKLIDLKDAGETVTVDDIKDIIKGYEIFNLFEISDYVVSGQSSKVLKMLRALISEGSSPVLLTSLLQQHFSSLYLVKNNKKPLGNRAFLVPKFRQQAQRYSNEQLENIIIEISEADSQLRRSGMPPQATLEVLAMSLCGERK